MKKYNPYEESCKISTHHMSQLAIKERDTNHNNFMTHMNILSLMPSYDSCRNNDSESTEDEEVKKRRKDEIDTIVKGGVFITNKNCYFKRYHSKNGEWEKQFLPLSNLDNRGLFNVQTKRKNN